MYILKYGYQYDINVMSTSGHKQVWGRENTTKVCDVADIAVQMLRKQDKKSNLKKSKSYISNHLW